MFTPPPSPSPPTAAFNGKDIDTPCPLPCKKKRLSRFFRLATVLFPFLAVAFMTYFLHARRPGSPTASTRWIVDSALPMGHHRQVLHRRDTSNLPSSSPTPSPTSTAPPSSTDSQVPVSDQLVPTVPGSSPVLPTPFPQALDSGVAQNFSTASCLSFFANMTSDASFRTCRPFSLLLGTSGAFINAQTNLTLLNSIIWGTCNTPTPYDRCRTNMASFAASLQTNCAQELKEQNVMASNTLIGLQAFEILYTGGCLADPNSDTYCYLTAAVNPNPFDLYLYSLPLGIPVPNSSATTCSACSKSVMGLYADNLRSGASGTSALKTTFYSALTMCQSGCGADFSLVGAGLNPEANAARRAGYMLVRNVLALLGAWALVFWFV